MTLMAWRIESEPSRATAILLGRRHNQTFGVALSDANVVGRV